MLTTAAGTISPAVVFIIGSGVAGLQAIATAKRLGAKVFAFDVRKEVKEQIESLGAKFVEINVGDVKASEGYAKELKQEQLERQKQEMIKILKKSDIVITTAQVFGRKAPLVIDKSMIKNMKKGSIIIDLAIETGGNVEGAEIDKEILINDVLIIGPKNLPSNLYKDASQMYSMNVFYFLESFWKNEGFKFDINDKILKNCLITYDGKIVNEKIKQG